MLGMVSSMVPEAHEVMIVIVSKVTSQQCFVKLTNESLTPPPFFPLFLFTIYNYRSMSDQGRLEQKRLADANSRYLYVVLHEALRGKQALGHDTCDAIPAISLPAI